MSGKVCFSQLVSVRLGELCCSLFVMCIHWRLLFPSVGSVVSTTCLSQLDYVLRLNVASPSLWSMVGLQHNVGLCMGVQGVCGAA